MARRVLVTGGSRGLGLAVATQLAAGGTRVVLAARDATAVARALERLPGSGHDGLGLDVGDAAAWPAAMDRIDAGGELHGLVAAAGVLGPIGAVDEIDPLAFRTTMQTNVDGTLLALSHTMARLQAAGTGAAVTFSGGGGTGPLERYDAYAASKAAVVRLTENVARAVRGRGVTVNAIAPGFVATGMHEATLAAGPDAAGADYYERTRVTLAEGGTPPELAAELAAFLLGPEAREITGKLISAAWDPWRDPSFRRRLADEPDLATLRRIDNQFFEAVG